MTDDQFKKAAQAAERIGAWRYAAQRIAEWEEDDYGLFYRVEKPPSALWDTYKQSVLDWVNARLAEAEAEFAVL